MDFAQRMDGSNTVIKAAMTVVGIICVVAMFVSPTMSVSGPYGSVLVTSTSIFAILLITGFAVGAYGTVVGIGGGPIIVPILFFFYAWDAQFLVATSLMIVFLNSLSGSVGYAKQKRIDYVGGIKFALAALPGAILSGFVHHRFNIRAFDIIFGVFLLLLAAYCLLKAKQTQPDQVPQKRGDRSYRRLAFVDQFGVKFNFRVNDRLGISMNLLLGFFVGFLGIGGGVFQVPILLFLLSYPPHVATATSHFITMLTCLFAVIPHLYFGTVHFGEVMWMGLGVVIGAQAGAWLAPKVNAKFLIYLFVVVILVFALKLLL